MARYWGTFVERNSFRQIEYYKKYYYFWSCYVQLSKQWTYQVSFIDEQKPQPLRCIYLWAYHVCLFACYGCTSENQCYEKQLTTWKSSIKISHKREIAKVVVWLLFITFFFKA